MSNLLPETSRPEQVVYAVCRPVHFVTMATALPVGYLALQSAGVSGVPVWLLWLAWLGAAFWALAYFGLHSFSYPTRALEALFTTGSPLLNLWLAGSESFVEGALSVVQASMVASCVGFVVVLVILRVPALREQHLATAPPWAGKLLLGLLVPMLFVAWVFGAFTFGGWPRDTWSTLGAFGFLNQVGSELRVLYAGSVFAGPIDQGSERSRLHQAWGPLVAICMLGSVTAFLGIAMWYS